MRLVFFVASSIVLKRANSLNGAKNIKTDLLICYNLTILL